MDSGILVGQEIGIDELRKVVGFYEWQNETFNQSFSIEELVKLYRYAMAHPELPEFPDTWEEEQIQQALNNGPVVTKRR